MQICSSIDQGRKFSYFTTSNSLLIIAPVIVWWLNNKPIRKFKVKYARLAAKLKTKSKRRAKNKIIPT